MPVDRALLREFERIVEAERRYRSELEPDIDAHIAVRYTFDTRTCHRVAISGLCELKSLREYWRRNPLQGKPMAFKSMNTDPPKVPALSIGVTGHRPDKLYSETGKKDGYEFGNPLRRWIRSEIRRTTHGLVCSARRDGYDPGYRDSFLSRVRWQNGWEVNEKWRTIEVLCLHGGAQGADQDAAAEWYKMGYPYVVVAPFPNQDSLWPAESRARFAKVLEFAAGIYLVSDKEPQTREEASQMLLQRNETLCQMSDELIAVWDGSRGGTSHCVGWWNKVQCGAHLTLINPEDNRVPF